MNRLLPRLVVAAALAALAAGGWLWWQPQRPSAPPAESAPAAAQPAAPSAQPAEPAIRHPIEAAPAAQVNAQQATLPPLDQSDAYVTDALGRLLDRKAVRSFLQLDGFVRRVVATVDNLARSHAAPRLWPVNPAPGRFTVDKTPDGPVVAASNGLRYGPFVQLMESVDADRAAGLYVQMYPLFQRAYEELGYPGRHFNDRVVEVIDHLLATPEPAGPLRVELTKVRGPIEPVRPWVRYEYVDAAIESRSAGQKLLLRMGRDNAQRVKAKLAEIRRRVASAP